MLWLVLSHRLAICYEFLLSVCMQMKIFIGSLQLETVN